MPPTPAAEWAKTCGRQLAPLCGSASSTDTWYGLMCQKCAESYARQQVEAASLSRAADVFAGIIAERDRLLDEFSMALKQHGLMTSQRQVYPFDAAIERLVKQRVAAALERAAQHLENASYLVQSEYLHNVLKSHAAAIRALET